jgi:hypothetical protein
MQHDPGGSEEIGPFTLNAGKYYVGDLQHVFDCSTWGDVVKCFPEPLQNDNMSGKFTLPSGRVIVMFNLPSNGFRRRDYTDMHGRDYYMNSSLMGITLVENLESEYKDEKLKTCTREHGETWSHMMERVGNVVEYKDSFSCSSVVTVQKDGSIMGGDCKIAMIRLGGKVCIDTNEDMDDSDGDDGNNLDDLLKGGFSRRIAQGLRAHALEKAGKSKCTKPKPKSAGGVAKKSKSAGGVAKKSKSAGGVAKKSKSAGVGANK